MRHNEYKALGRKWYNYSTVIIHVSKTDIEKEGSKMSRHNTQSPYITAYGLHFCLLKSKHVTTRGKKNCTGHKMSSTFWARSQNFEKRLLASSRLSIRIELGSHTTDFHKIWHFEEFFENLSRKCKPYYKPTNIAVILNWAIPVVYIQGVPGGMCQTSGECSLC